MDANANGRNHVLISNALVIEALRFAFWIVLFLWLASSINGRMSRSEGANRAQSKRLARIEKHLDLLPLTAEQ